MRPRNAVGLALVAGLLLSGCGDDKKDTGTVAQVTPSASASASAAPSETPVPEAVDPASVKANELGSVPVMMYHVIKDAAKGEYDQTPAEFRAELERMHKDGFVPITTRQLVQGDIDIPAGKHPVVMTFDDSSPGQIQIGADGNPTADSAVGILEAFSKENPDFPATASFYVNSSPFNDPKAVPWLIANGYEVGLHTMNHINLKQSSETTIQKELAGNADEIKTAAPDADTDWTLALPLGIGPSNKSLIHEGSYEGKSYKIIGALLVGANPAKSPFNADFDPYAIARIRSGPKTKRVDFDSSYWLDDFEAGKWTAYTSDGDPDKISYPSTSKSTLGSEFTSKANKYDPSGSTSGSASPSPSSTASSSSGPEGADSESASPSSTSTP